MSVVTSRVNAVDTCSRCGRKAGPSVRFCIVCNEDVGFPNVRAALREPELAKLHERYEEAVASSKAHGTVAQLEAFRLAADGSSVLMNRDLGTLNSWVNSLNEVFLNFHQQVRLGSRSPKENEWDRQRVSAENTISPGYFEELCIGALGLDNLGMTYYGPYTIVLDEFAIQNRASVFEENPFIFNNRHSVISGRDPPPGYRASWADRGLLAAAKLHSKVLGNTAAADFPGLILERKLDDPDCDFIEVHIYGWVHASSIKSVSGPVPTDEMDQMIWRQTKRKLAEIGAVVEEI